METDDSHVNESVLSWRLEGTAWAQHRARLALLLSTIVCGTILLGEWKFLPHVGSSVGDIGEANGLGARTSSHTGN